MRRIVLLALTTTVALDALPALANCNYSYTCTPLYSAPPAAPAVPSACPIFPMPNGCLNWTAPRYCVNAPGNFSWQTHPDALSCTSWHDTIQAAINAATADGVPLQTIKVYRDYEDFAVYNEKLDINFPLCLKPGPERDTETPWANIYWQAVRYPVHVESPPTSSAAVTITPSGSGSCIYNFKIRHHGTGHAIYAGAGGALPLVNNVTLVDNFIEQVNHYAHGVEFSGSDNWIARNVVKGSGLSAFTSGVAGIHLYKHGGLAGCPVTGNNILGNLVVDFDNGIQLYLRQDNGVPPCLPLTNRVDANDIRQTHIGVVVLGTDSNPATGNVVSNNKVTAGLVRASSPPADTASEGIGLADIGGTIVFSNDISDVDIGIRFHYGACQNLAKANNIQARTRGIHVCPSDGNRMAENNVGGTGAINSVGIDFTDTGAGGKPLGRHCVNGGVIHSMEDAFAPQSYIQSPMFSAPIPVPAFWQTFPSE